MTDSKKTDWAGHDMPRSDDIDWGGQAFPTEGGDFSGLYPDPGMSLRAFIAAKVIGGLCANPSIFQADNQSGWGLVNCTERQLSDCAVRIADEMIASLKAGG